MESFYIDSRGCVRVGNDVSEKFPVNVELRQGCVMSPCLLNNVNTLRGSRGACKGLGKGLELLSVNSGRFKPAIICR